MKYLCLLLSIPVFGMMIENKVRAEDPPWKIEDRVSALEKQVKELTVRLEQLAPKSTAPPGAVGSGQCYTDAYGNTVCTSPVYSRSYAGEGGGCSGNGCSGYSGGYSRRGFFRR